MHIYLSCNCLCVISCDTVLKLSFMTSSRSAFNSFHQLQSWSKKIHWILILISTKIGYVAFFFTMARDNCFRCYEALINAFFSVGITLFRIILRASFFFFCKSSNFIFSNFGLNLLKGPKIVFNNTKSPCNEPWIV